MKFEDFGHAFYWHIEVLRIFFQDLKQLLGFGKLDWMSFEKEIFIDRLYFEVTNICNAKCIFCGYQFADHKTGVMGFEVFKKAIDEYAEKGGKTVSFTPTVGEPLLDPGLFEKIEYAVNLKGIKKVYFYSNGLLLGQNYKKIVDSGLNEIHISTSGLEKEEFESIYAVKGYENLLNGLEKLLKYNSELNEKIKISIEFRSLRYPSELKNLPDFKRVVEPYLSENVKMNFMSGYDNWGGSIKQKDLLGIMKLSRPHFVKKIPCTRTFDASILFDGSVRLCACRILSTEFDELVVGNVMNNSLDEIFHSPQAHKVRKSFEDNDLLPVCKNCTLYNPITKAFFEQR